MLWNVINIYLSFESSDYSGFVVRGPVNKLVRELFELLLVFLSI